MLCIVKLMAFFCQIISLWGMPVLRYFHLGHNSRYRLQKIYIAGSLVTFSFHLCTLNTSVLEPTWFGFYSLNVSHSGGYFFSLVCIFDSPPNPMVLGCIAASALLRKAASIAFETKKRATLTTDIIECLGRRLWHLVLKSFHGRNGRSFLLNHFVFGAVWRRYARPADAVDLGWRWRVRGRDLCSLVLMWV